MVLDDLVQLFVATVGLMVEGWLIETNDVVVVPLVGLDNNSSEGAQCHLYRMINDPDARSRTKRLMPQHRRPSQKNSVNCDEPIVSCPRLMSPEKSTATARGVADTVDNSTNVTINVRGPRISLGPVSRAHQDDYRRWFNDFQVQRTAGILPSPWNHDAFESFFTNRILMNEDAAWFTVYENDTERPIGFAGIRDIDHRHRTAEFFVTIGEGDARGKGYGTEATILTLDYAFTALGLHNVMLDVLSPSLAGIRAYEKAGFREIGRRRECEMMGGRLWDMVFMECLSTEFESPVLKHVFKPDAPRLP